MFRINDNKGFQITFDNGYTVSVQFGPGNYGSNYNADFVANMNKPQTASVVETALISPSGDFVPYQGEDVQGYVNADSVLKLLNYARSL